jgi:hypothetical protein
MNIADESIFDFSNMTVNGLKVLAEGLAEMPMPLDSSSVTPLAYWKDSHCGAVLFLRYSTNDDGTLTPVVIRGAFRRERQNWKPLHHWSGSGWSHDPITNPDSLADLDAQAIGAGGGQFTDQPKSDAPAIVISGRHSPDVKDISVIQRGFKLTAPATGHYGAWIVCLDEWAPYAIEASDENGAVLGRLQGPPRLPGRERMK